MGVRAQEGKSRVTHAVSYLGCPGLSAQGTFVAGGGGLDPCGWFARSCGIRLATHLFMMDVFENEYHAIKS